MPETAPAHFLETAGLQLPQRFFYVQASAWTIQETSLCPIKETTRSALSPLAPAVSPPSPARPPATLAMELLQQPPSSQALTPSSLMPLAISISAIRLSTSSVRSTPWAKSPPTPAQAPQATPATAAPPQAQLSISPRALPLIPREIFSSPTHLTTSSAWSTPAELSVRSSAT